VLGNPEIRLVSHAPDAEVYLGEQFLGIVFPDDHKEGRNFFFEMVMYEEEIEEFRRRCAGASAASSCRLSHAGGK
jgi:hypothetical protein